MRPDDPAPRLRRSLRLETLRRRRARWRQARAARKALFSRPTPVSDRLRIAAGIHKAVDYVYLAACLLLAIRFMAQLLGYRDLSVPFHFSEYHGFRALTELQTHLPPIQFSPNHQIDLPALVALLIISLIARALHLLIHFLAYRLPRLPDIRGSNSRHP